MSLRCPQLTQLLANLCFRSVAHLPILCLLGLYSYPSCSNPPPYSRPSQLILPNRWNGITPEQWVCPRLQHVNLFGARHLESASLAVILGQCPGLKQINLSESLSMYRLARITMVNVEASSKMGRPSVSMT